MMQYKRQIASIAIPAIISNITTPLLAMVDIAIAGHLGSAVYIAAIALGGSMFNLLYWPFGFLRMGTSGITAQTFGADDKAGSAAVFYRSLAIAMAIGLVILLAGRPIASLLLRFMDPTPDTATAAGDYFAIALLGAPATLGSYALSGWFLGMQNSRAPMYMALTTNTVNIAASLTLVYGTGMRIEGVATGSAIAQWAGFMLGIAIVGRSYRPAFPSAAKLIDASELKCFFSINTDIFLRTLCLAAVTVWFTRAGSIQGTDTLAANALLLQLFMFFSYFTDGVAYAGEALAGKLYGRRDFDGLKSLIRSLSLCGLWLAAAFSAAYLCFGDRILSLLTSDLHILDLCSHYRWWAVAIPIAATTAFVWDGILIGLTRTRIMLASMAVAAGVFFAVYFISRTEWGNHGLWFAFLLYLAVRGVAEQLIYEKTSVHRQ